MDAVSKLNISKCDAGIIPSISSYILAINIYGIILATIGAFAVLLVLIFFIDTLIYIVKNSSSSIKTYSAFVIAVYPVVAIATFFAILMPRSQLLSEALTQGVFMVAMYQMFCLFVAYCEGEAELIRRIQPKALNLKIPPCCCCCFCLPQMEVTKKTIRRLRLMVLQLPLVQGFAYLILLMMWAEQENLHQVNNIYVQPIVIPSILIGIWGMAMTVKLLKNFLGDEFKIIKKFAVLQLILFFGNLQSLIIRILVLTDTLPCNPPITPSIYANLIQNTLLLAEMVILSALARKLYKKKLPNCKINYINTNVSTIGGLMFINNNRDTCNDFNSQVNLNNPEATSKCNINVAINLDE